VPTGARSGARPGNANARIEDHSIIFLEMEIGSKVIRQVENSVFWPDAQASDQDRPERDRSRSLAEVNGRQAETIKIYKIISKAQ